MMKGWCFFPLFLSFFYLTWVRTGACLCLTSMLCNRPEACSVGEEGAASSWAFQGDDSAGVRDKEDIVGISLHRLLSLFGSFSASLVHLPPLLLLRRLSVQSFITTALSAHGTEGGKCPGFTMRYSNERRRGDSAVSAQRPHLLPFFLLPVSVWISVCLSRMHSAVSARAPARPYPPTLHKYQMGRDYIPLLAFRLDSWVEVLSLVAEISRLIRIW